MPLPVVKINQLIILEFDVPSYKLKEYQKLKDSCVGLLEGANEVWKDVGLIRIQVICGIRKAVLIRQMLKHINIV